MRILSCLLGVLIAFAHLTPASAELIELKVKPALKRTTGSSEKSKNNQPRQKTLKDCSRAFHTVLQNVSATQLSDLKAAYENARAMDKSLPGRILITPPKSEKTDLQKKAVAKARLSVRYRGRSPWLVSNDPGWAIRQMISDLQNYIEQPFHPYLCTGASRYVGFLGQYLPKAERAVEEAALLSKVQNERAVLLANHLWFDLRKPSIPQIAPPPPAPVFSLKDEIRPAKFDDDEVSVTDGKDEIQTNSTQVLLPDPDLPLLSERKNMFALNNASDAKNIISKLMEKASELALVQIDPKPEMDTEKRQGEGSEPLKEKPLHFIAELKRAANLIETNRANGNLNRREGDGLSGVLSALEFEFYLQAKEQQLQNLHTALKATLDAVSSQQAEHCMCGQ